MLNVPPYLGASFHKCDFQVHSLRDQRWEGPFDRMSGRHDFSAALVSACRRKGLSAIAITDHHDLCLWPYVRDAAKAETRADGSLLDPAERLLVFPGIELTLSSPPCQVILLFDPDIQETTLNHVWGVLNVVPTDASVPGTTMTQQLGTDRTIKAITDGLASLRLNPEETNPNKFRFLDGHFIILPHVGPGHKSMLRTSFQSHYAECPFVGGYIEKRLYTALDLGDRNKLEGRDLAWGKKAIGVFQTSDCRIATQSAAGSPVEFVELGDWPTWVKWANASTEALRQACLAKSSRILQSEPAFPLLQIIGVHVSDSVFLGPVELGLSPQLNSFIGGRGTGKSSLLEYIRWALFDDPTLSGAVESELPNFEKRRKALIDHTLKPKDAFVTVYYKRNEVSYAIQRSVTASNDTCTVTDNAGNVELMKAAQVRQQFPILSYAQKQLSSVGTLPDEIHRLITDPIKAELDTLSETIETELLPALRQQRINRRRLQDMDIQIAATKSANKGRREQISALQAQLKSLTPEQRRTIDLHASFTDLEQWTRRSTESVHDLGRLLSDLRNKVQSPEDIAPPETLPNAQDILQLANGFNRFRSRTLAFLNDLVNESSGHNWLTAEERESLSAIEVALASHSTSYDACIAESAKNQKQLEEIQSLNRQLSASEQSQLTLESERTTLNATLIQLGDVAWRRFQEALTRRGDILFAQCTEIYNQARHAFRPIVRPQGNDRNIRTAVAEIIEGRGVRDSETKITSLTAKVTASPNPTETWQGIMAELDSLVAARESATLPSVPILSDAGFTSTNLESLRKGLMQETLEKNRFFNIPDLIEFEFRRGTKNDGTENYIPFVSASPGQQATCLLETLLAQDGAPLLIDQPEEDLDNEQIQSISERISVTKTQRQLIFVSHNANIVVNGDSELVACFRYRDQDDSASGLIAPVGSIDCEAVRDTITAVMEGGKPAFELRREKYGF